MPAKKTSKSGKGSRRGAEQRKLDPKLRVIRNGGHRVNQLRAERCPAVAVSSLDADVERQREPSSPVGAARSPARVPAAAWENTSRGPANVVVDVFMELSSADVELPAEWCSCPPAKEVHERRGKEHRVGDCVHVAQPGALKVIGRHGAFVSAEVSLARLDELMQRKEVVHVEVGQPVTYTPPLLSDGGKAGRRAPGKRVKSRLARGGGDGVLIGIIDVGGFDFAHPDFVDEKGKTRFVEIWDQAIETRRPPEGYTYGARIEARHMNRALDLAKKEGQLPATVLEPQSMRVRSSHATHVASIAAGNRGVCPKAEIAGVSLALPSSDLDPRLSFYDSTRLAHAVDYLFELGRHRERPVSINISLGTNGHAHDGTSIANRWLDSALAAPGRCITVAAGNAGQEAPTGPNDFGFMQGRIHASGRIPATGLTRDLEWIVVGDGKGDLSENEIEIWYSMQDRFSVQLKPPDGDWLEAIDPREFIENRVLRENQTVVSIFNELYSPANGHNHISIHLSPFFSESGVVGVTPGKWIVRLIGIDIRDGAFDAWIERDDPRRLRTVLDEEGWAFPSFFSLATNVDDSSVNTLACGHSVIAVGNLDEEREEMHVTSSQGPTRDERAKPEVAAPGTAIRAANGFDRPGRDWVEMTGTSMASPYVAGVVGLMLGIDDSLTAAQIAGILRRSAVPLPGSDFGWKTDAGYGAIDPGLCLREAGTINSKRDQTTAGRRKKG